MMNNKKILLTGVAALLVFNGFALYENHRLNLAFEKFKTSVEPLVNRFELCKLIDCFDQEFLDKHITDVTLVVLLPANSECNTCIISNNQTVNFILKHGGKVNPYLKIVLIGHFDDDIKNKFHEQEFDLVTIEKQAEIFKENFSLHYPVFTVIDKHSVFLSNEIIADQVFLKERQIAFWESSTSFLSNVYNL